MDTVWSDKSKYKLWLGIEIEYLTYLAQYVGNLELHHNVYTKLRKTKIDSKFVSGVRYKYNNSQHEMVAFLDQLGKLPYVHVGLTSSDVMDTALFMQLRIADKLIVHKATIFAEDIKALAVEHENTIVSGLTHGVVAEPTTVGMRMCNYYEEISRCIKRIEGHKYYCKLRGPVGTFTGLGYVAGHTIEDHLAFSIELSQTAATTQVIDRKIIAAILFDIVLLVTALEKICTDMRLHVIADDIRLMSKSKYVGSSAMRHKTNPYLFERVCGVNRILKGMMPGILDNCVGWMERDLTNSIFERETIPRLYKLAFQAILTTRTALQGVNFIEEGPLPLNAYKHYVMCREALKHGLAPHRFLGEITDHDMSMCNKLTAYATSKTVRRL